jgi:hypothetical protein
LDYCCEFDFIGSCFGWKQDKTNIPPRAPIIKEVIWRPSLSSWAKCNTDGASIASASACGGLFWNHNADLLGCFAEKLDYVSAFFAELGAVLRAIEIAVYKNWSNLWIETD